MEENEQQEQNSNKETTQQQSPQVGFPLPSRETKKQKGSKLIWIVLAIVIIIGAIIYILTRTLGSNEEAGETPTPSATQPAFTPSPTSAASPIPKEEVSIEIQNGTGISGAAASLESDLKTLGYSDITASNAENQDYTATQVTFSTSLDQTNVDTITNELEDVYQSVDVSTSSSQTADVVIITGLKKDETSKPSASPKATPTSSPTESASPTASPTPTP